MRPIRVCCRWTIRPQVFDPNALTIVWVGAGAPGCVLVHQRRMGPDLRITDHGEQLGRLQPQAARLLLGLAASSDGVPRIWPWSLVVTCIWGGPSNANQRPQRRREAGRLAKQVSRALVDVGLAPLRHHPKLGLSFGAPPPPVVEHHAARNLHRHRVSSTRPWGHA